MIREIKSRAQIKRKELLAPSIYRMSIETDLCEDARPGQFVMVYPPGGAKLLGRPLCIADAGEYLDIVFRTVGAGTGEIASLNPGDSIYIEGPLGQGYPTDRALTEGKRVLLLAGGLGAPSLLYLAKKFKEEQSDLPFGVILGYRDSGLNHFLADDFRNLGIETVIATDDGSEGIRGNVIDAMISTGKKPNLIYACGPLPMLSAVKKYASENNVEAYISLEEHMACGIGVCLGCVVKTTSKDPHSHVNNARICTEGPVFDAKEVDI